MSLERLHFIRACGAETQNSSHFDIVIGEIKAVTDAAKLDANRPPPKRIIRLTVELADYEQLLHNSLRRTFTLVLDKDLIFEDGAVKLDPSATLEILVTRMARDNPLVRFYGLKIILFVEGLDEQRCVDIEFWLSGWAPRVSAELGIHVTYELAESEADLLRQCKNEHRRMVCGDIRSQCAAPAEDLV